MSDFEYGPVEIFVVEFEGDRPDAGVLEAILDLRRSDTLRLLDMVIASRLVDGTITMLELTEHAAGLGFDGVGLEIQGLLGEDDIAEAIAPVAPGFSIAVVAFEHRWATTLAERLVAARGTVVRSERIPAAAVNQIVNSLAEAGA